MPRTTLTADMVCPAGVDGLVIGAHQVRIDLNGYDITSPNSGHEIREIDAVGSGLGIRLRNTSRSVVERSRVGIVELGSDPGFLASANRIVGNDADSIHLHGCRTYKNEIANNQIHPATQFTAVSLDHGATANQVIANRIVTGTVWLGGVSDNWVTDNIIDNTVPSWIHAGVIMASHPSSCAGWALVDATGNVARGNTIIGGPIGVEMVAGSRRNKIMDSKIYDQSVAGLRFFVGSDDNEARGNTYRPAPLAVDVVDLGQGNLWP